MKNGKSDKIVDTVNIVLLTLITMAAILPFVYLVSLSLSNHKAILENRVGLIPVGFQMDAYKNIFIDRSMLDSMRFTALLTVIGSVFSMFMTVCAAYPLSKKRLKGRVAILLIISFTMFFNGGIIPTYLVVKGMGLIDTMWACILPVSINTYNMFIVKTYFSSSIPDSMEEAAVIDGCNDLRILINIILPISIPILATVGLFYAVARWNTFFNALMYINNPQKYTLQLKLRQLLIMDQLHQEMDSEEMTRSTTESIKAAVIVFSTVPILCVYPWLQKYFVKGVMLGAIKG